MEAGARHTAFIVRKQTQMNGSVQLLSSFLFLLEPSLSIDAAHPILGGSSPFWKHPHRCMERCISMVIQI